jgi:hypothetical protein
VNVSRLTYDSLCARLIYWARIYVNNFYWAHATWGWQANYYLHSRNYVLVKKVCSISMIGSHFYEYEWLRTSCENFWLDRCLCDHFYWVLTNSSLFWVRVAENVMWEFLTRQVSLWSFLLGPYELITFLSTSGWECKCFLGISCPATNSAYLKFMDYPTMNYRALR